MITLNNETKEATISADRKTITGGPGMLLHSELTWVSPDEAEQIRNRPKEPVTCPSVPHPLQPGKPGKLLFLSGPPGTGKSTMASLISERENRVFYEGDGFFLGFNPYISLGEDQVKCRSEKPALIGPGMKERLKGMFDYFGFTMTVARERTVRNRRGKASKPIDHSGKDRFLQLMAEDIARERMRVGGDWVVAFAVYDREDRDIFRKVLGNEVIFVLLDLDKDLMKKRLSRRKKGEGRRFARLRSRFEKIRAGEKRTLSYLVPHHASEEENVEAVLELVKRFEKTKVSFKQVATWPNLLRSNH